MKASLKNFHVNPLSMRKLSDRIARLLAIATLASLLPTRSGWCQGVEDVQASVRESDRILAAEVSPLHLEGRTAAEAIADLSLNGYRCGIAKNFFPTAHFSLPISCNLYGSPKYPACRLHAVRIYIHWAIDSGDRVELHAAIARSKVERLDASCLPAITLVDRPMTSSQSAELDVFMKRLDPVGHPFNQTWSTLSADNFECGTSSGREAGYRSVVCWSREPLVSGCRRVDLEFSFDRSVSQDSFLNPEEYEVRSVRESCMVAPAKPVTKDSPW